MSGRSRKKNRKRIQMRGRLFVFSSRFRVDYDNALTATGEELFLSFLQSKNTKQSGQIEMNLQLNCLPPLCLLVPLPLCKSISHILRLGKNPSTAKVMKRLPSGLKPTEEPDPCIIISLVSTVFLGLSLPLALIAALPRAAPSSPHKSHLG